MGLHTGTPLTARRRLRGTRRPPCCTTAALATAARSSPRRRRRAPRRRVDPRPRPSPVEGLRRRSRRLPAWRRRLPAPAYARQRRPPGPSDTLPRSRTGTLRSGLTRVRARPSSPHHPRSRRNGQDPLRDRTRTTPRRRRRRRNRLRPARGIARPRTRLLDDRRPPRSSVRTRRCRAIAARVRRPPDHVVFDNVEHLLPGGSRPLAELVGRRPDACASSSRAARPCASRARLSSTFRRSSATRRSSCSSRAGEACGPRRRNGNPSRELCDGLDRLPLALELAAARTKLLTPEQLLERLSQRLDVLKGTRDADQRHATLRATIAWSYDLLQRGRAASVRAPQRLSRRVHARAAEAVCDADLDASARSSTRACFAVAPAASATRCTGCLKRSRSSLRSASKSRTKPSRSAAATPSTCSRS